MEKTTHYLSVGHMRYHCERGGKDFLTVESRNDVHFLLPQEEVLWAALKHKPLTYDEAISEYETLLNESDVDENIPFEDCLLHMRELGLVVTGNGEDEIEAKYDLMRDVLILPFPESVVHRAKIACYLVTRKGVSISRARALFPERRLSHQETEVLALVRETPLTAAELVMLVECKTWSDETVNSVTESIDLYGSKAMRVYADMMYSSIYLEGVLDAVFALREDRRVVFM